MSSRQSLSKLNRRHGKNEPHAQTLFPHPQSYGIVHLSKTNATTPILTTPTPAELREELEMMVVRDLLGPAGGPEEEPDDARVHDRHLVGMLAPQKLQTMPEELDELGIAEEGSEDSGPVNADVSQVASLSPSSIGMSFCVDKDATSLLVTARWGHYQRGESATMTTTKGTPKKVWRRSQRGGANIGANLSGY